MMGVIRIEIVLYMVDVEVLSVRGVMQRAGYCVGVHGILQVIIVGIHIGFGLMLEREMVGDGRRRNR